MPATEHDQRQDEQQAETQMSKKHPLVKGILQELPGPLFGNGDGNEVERIQGQDSK